MTDWETRYYEAEASHTESNGMLAAERDHYKQRYEDAMLAIRDGMIHTRKLADYAGALEAAVMKVCPTIQAVLLRLPATGYESMKGDLREVLATLGVALSSDHTRTETGQNDADEWEDMDDMLAHVAGVPCRFCGGPGSDKGRCPDCGKPSLRTQSGKKSIDQLAWPILREYISAEVRLAIARFHSTHWVALGDQPTDSIPDLEIQVTRMDMALREALS